MAFESTNGDQVIRSGNASGRYTKAFRIEKNVVVAPIPSASVTITIAENARWRPIWRMAELRSEGIVFIV